MKLHSATVFLAAQCLTRPLLVRGYQDSSAGLEVSKSTNRAVRTGSYSLRAYAAEATKGAQGQNPMQPKILMGLCIPSTGKGLDEPDIGILATDTVLPEIDECIGQDVTCVEDSSSPSGGFCIPIDSESVHPDEEEELIDASVQRIRNLTEETLSFLDRQIDFRCSLDTPCPENSYCYFPEVYCYSCDTVTTAYCNAISENDVDSGDDCLQQCVPDGDPVHPQPTNAPTLAPTSPPTLGPTAAPTSPPTLGPTAAPTSPPTLDPTAAPTSPPTLGPTATPTSPPTSAPTTPPDEIGFFQALVNFIRLLFGGRFVF